MTQPGTTEESGPAQRLGRRALDGVLWTFSSAAAKSVMQVLVLVVLARLLDPTAFGVVAAALLIVRLAASLSTAGVGAAIIQKQNLEPQDLSTAFAFFLFTGTAASLTIALAAPALAALFRMEPLELVLVVLAPAVLLETAGELASMLLRRRLRFLQLAAAAFDALLGQGIKFGRQLSRANWNSPQTGNRPRTEQTLTPIVPILLVNQRAGSGPGKMTVPAFFRNHSCHAGGNLIKSQTYS